jgi:hypothetical protein
METKQCEACKKIIYRTEKRVKKDGGWYYYCHSDKRWKNKRFCSKECVGVVFQRERKGILMAPVMTDETKKKLSLSRIEYLRNHRHPMEGRKHKPSAIEKLRDRRGAKNPNWRAGKASYRSLHSWVEREKGKARVCRNREKQFLPYPCSCKCKIYHWANVSRVYKRDLNDWVELCTSCHLTADRRGIELKQ